MVWPRLKRHLLAYIILPRPFCGNLCGAWRRVKTWKKHELPKRAPPLVPLVVCGLAGLARAQGREDVAISLLLGLHCMLRGAELRALCVRDFLFAGRRAVVHLGWTKGSARKGAPEEVVVTDERLVNLLRDFCADRGPNDPLVDLTPTALFRYFRALLTYFELGDEGFTLHSLRRGGATHFFRTTGNMGATLERGRWTCVRTGRGYISEGLAVVGLLSLRVSVRELLCEWSKALQCQ